MKKIIFESYKDDVVFVENGYKKHYLYFDNCDPVNSLIYFSLVMFDEGELTIDCDIPFWMEWLDFFCKANKITKNFKFSGDVKKILDDKVPHKKKRPVLMFSGGKDSTTSLYHLPEPHTMVFKAQHYAVENYPRDSEFFSTNLDNELYHCKKKMRGRLHLELFFPLINKYRDTFMGIEKEVWDYPEGFLFYDIPEYSEFLCRHGLVLDSAIKHLYSPEIIEYLLKYDIPFSKCGGDDFCYKDERCLNFFIMGCNKEEHTFDREKYLNKHPKLKAHKDIHKTVDKIVKEVRTQMYFYDLIAHHWKGI